MEAKDLRRRMILAPTPRERERWYAILLLAQGWTSSATALERDPHTIGRWASAFGEGKARSLNLRADRGFPLALGETQLAELRAAVQESPAMAGIVLANWNWRVVRQFFLERCSVSLCRRQLPELAALAGVCLQAPQEAAARGGRGQTGGLHNRVRRLAGRGGAQWGKDILCR